MRYAVEVDAKAEKEIRRLPTREQRQVIARIEALAMNRILRARKSYPAKTGFFEFVLVFTASFIISGIPFFWSPS